MAQLTATQLHRMKANQEKALQLRKARIANASRAESAVSLREVHAPSVSRDTGAGFFAEEGEESAEDLPLAVAPPPVISGERPLCLCCRAEFSDSFLSTHFDHNVCDNCRDDEGDHALISRTDAKREYLLKDCDLDSRPPPLRCILRRNPHRQHGTMRLYLRLQVEERAVEVFGTEDAIEERREEREESQLKRKKKAFDKRVKALRMEVRSSLFRKKDPSHVHSFGPDVHKGEDTYARTCTGCGHTVEFEQM